MLNTDISVGLQAMQVKWKREGIPFRLLTRSEASERLKSSILG